MTLQVAVIGANGRMGSAACAAIEADDDLAIAARIGRDDPLKLEGCDVALELSTPASVRENTCSAIGQGVHVVVGASGLSASDLRDIEALADEHSVGVLVAPNFALGAVLMMHFARQAAQWFDRAEIVERHHDKKLDAPSGTAARTAQLMDSVHEGPWASSPDEKESVAGARGADVDGVRIHSLRLPGSVAHQEVLFGAPGETLSIKHDSLDRSSFMPGILLALKRVPELSGLTVGLEHLLDL